MNPRIAAWWRWTIATAAGMIIGGFFTGMYVAARYEARLGKIARDTAIVDLLHDPATRVIPLEGAEGNPAAHGRVIWHEKLGGRLLATLPPAPAGKSYELWAITGGRPLPIGGLRVDESGSASVLVPPAATTIESFIVTLEPAGGVSAPTGPTVLASAGARPPEGRNTR